ncbi:staphylococcal nuclease domain-containing protein 1 [Cimex lectularius]|uniref:Staphylococcal nuclease domain-containing protein 1 n=1 Tax=Cimex lectularius TaxID=79782 RepID=A0A8I6RE35_CIMLE|nr:staphylococcal nuclease domain-containing protein 1 [Cimex lectularius]
MSAPRTRYEAKVQEVISGDTLRLLRREKGEGKLILSGLKVPKILKKSQKIQSEEEPFAWEAREFLRKRLLKQLVTYEVETNANLVSTTDREYGTVFHGNVNINELLLKEGLADCKSETGEKAKLVEEAKKAGKGKWGDLSKNNGKRSVRFLETSELLEFVNQCEKKPIKAIIERVIDGSTVEACLLLPEHTYVTLMISGIRCPQIKRTEGEEGPVRGSGLAEEARKFTEMRLLQQEVEIVLESTNSYMVVGSVIHPLGNIAERLVEEGYAHCVDWSLETMNKADADKLVNAEKVAKEKKLNIWKDHSPPKVDDKHFTGTVVEIVNGDALMVKMPNGVVRKIFLAGIRPPKEQPGANKEAPPKTDGQRQRPKRPLYDIPWMFDAREFLRKKLIGKKVNVTHNYTQPARDNFPEKHCCNVTINNVNVAEALVSKGLAHVFNYRAENDNRPSAINSLKAAEEKAKKGNKGVHSKKEFPVHRVNDICSDPVKSKNLLPHFSRHQRIEAVVEFVASGSRLRLYLPKDTHLITFLLSGIEVRYSNGDAVNNEEAATAFTREKCMQRDVEIQIESTDRNGNFIGWLWVDNVNLSVALVEAGLAKIHFSGENSKYSKELQNAKSYAISKGLWKYAEKEDSHVVVEEDKTAERVVDYKDVVVVEVSDLSFYCQYCSQESKLTMLQTKLQQEMAANPPLPGAYTPRKGDLCAAKYPVDDGWYRAKVEKVSGNKVTVLYIDYGNKAEIQSVQCASIPTSFTEKPFAHLFTLAFVSMPKDIEDQKIATRRFFEDVCDRKLQLNVEYNEKNVSYATLYDAEREEDIGKALVEEGFILVSKRRERRLEKIMKEYQEAESRAKKERLNLWVYGDVTEDDDKEFGMGR